MTTSFVDSRAARSEEQLDVMKEISKKGECPFCGDNLFQWHKEPIIYSGDYWLVTPSRWPYKGTQTHLLVILKKHSETIGGAPLKAGGELIQIMRWVEKQFHLPGGALCIRFGDTGYSGGSVCHLHAHVVVPDTIAPDFSPVRFKIGQRTKK